MTLFWRVLSPLFFLQSIGHKYLCLWFVEVRQAHTHPHHHTPPHTTPHHPTPLKRWSRLSGRWFPWWFFVVSSWSRFVSDLNDVHALPKDCKCYVWGLQSPFPLLTLLDALWLFGRNLFRHHLVDMGGGRLPINVSCALLLHLFCCQEAIQMYTSPYE